MSKLLIKTVTGKEFTVEGIVTTKIIDGQLIYYVNGASYPASIVKSIEK